MTTWTIWIGMLALTLQAVSLVGVWVEIFSSASRAGRPPLARTVLVLAVLSGCFYFSSGFSDTPVDWIKVAYGGASVLTCGLNLAQWYFRPTFRNLGLCFVGLVFALMLIASLARAEWFSSLIGAQLAFWFLCSQGGGRIIQIRRFARVKPVGASLVLWSANVSLNVCMIIYHSLRAEWYWLFANLGSGCLGVVILWQIIRFRIPIQPRVYCCATKNAGGLCDCLGREPRVS